MNVKCPSCETIYRIDPAKIPGEGVRVRCAVCSFAIALSPTTPETDAATATTPDVAPAVVPQPQPAAEAPTVETVAEAEVPAVEIVPEAVAEPLEDDGVEEVAAPTAVAEETVTPGVATPAEELSPQRTEEGEMVTRMSEPFVAPQESAPPTAKPVTRPTAPVFKPTPGTPLQAPPVPPPVPVAEAEAPAPPASPAPPEEAPTPVEAPTPPVRPINPFLQRDPKQKARRLARALISDMIVYQPQKRQDALDSGTLKEEFEEEIKKSWEEYVDQIGDEIANSTTYFRDALNDILSGGQEMF